MDWLPEFVPWWFVHPRQVLFACCLCAVGTNSTKHSIERMEKKLTAIIEVFSVMYTIHSIGIDEIKCNPFPLNANNNFSMRFRFFLRPFVFHHFCYILVFVWLYKRRSTVLVFTFWNGTCILYRYFANAADWLFDHFLFTVL